MDQSAAARRSLLPRTAHCRLTFAVRSRCAQSDVTFEAAKNATAEATAAGSAGGPSPSPLPLPLSLSLSSPLRHSRTLSPPTAANSAAGTAGIAAPLMGVSTVRFQMATPMLLDSVQLRGRAVAHGAPPTVHILQVRAKLHAEDDYHTLPGSGYDTAVSSSKAEASPSSGGGAALAAVNARQRFRVCGLAKFVEVTLAGNARLAGTAKDDDTLLKKMDFGNSSPFPLSPASSSIEATIVSGPMDDAGQGSAGQTPLLAA